MPSKRARAAASVTRRQILYGVGALVLTAGCAASRHAASIERGHPMIVEYIRYEIPAERKAAFVDAYRDASTELRASKHCLRYEVTQCTEEPTSFVVRIEWDSLEGHTKGFRAEAEFPPFFAKVRPFFDQIREMRHYALIDVDSLSA